MNDSRRPSLYVFYEDNSKESLIIKNIYSKLSNYKLVIIPISQLKNFKNYYNNRKDIIFLSLGNSIYELESILKFKYNLLIIDGPEKYGKIPNNLKPLKTIIISDLNSLKYVYKIINNQNYKLFFKKDKYAYFLDTDNSILEQIIENKNKNSKLMFKQNKNKITFKKGIKDRLLIFFTQKKGVFRICSETCEIPDEYYVSSVYIPINRNFDIPRKYNELSIKIKKIFSLINENKFIDSYLFMIENKNEFNLEIFKKIFAIISKPLYKIEPDLKRDKNL